MTKRFVSVLLVCLLALSGLATLAQAEEAGSKVTVGTFTRPSGNYLTDMWGTNTSDLDVRTLLHDLSTVGNTADLQYGLNETVLSNVEVTEDSSGNKTYTFTLHNDLKYSDGSAITAEDYVFSVLLQSSAEVVELGAMPLVYAQLTGHDDYLGGKADVFKGVRLLGSRSFSLTIAAKNLPYFHELTYVKVTPYPISVIAPGCAVKDDGKGAYLAGGFTATLLQETIMDAQTGYMTHPAVSSGPYVLTSYDAATGATSFKLNPYYKGNLGGQKPTIETLELVEVKYGTALEQLTAGEIDIINKSTDGIFINEGMNLLAGEQIGASAYLRTGYGFIGFACEQSATASVAVRKAIAMCLDKEAFIVEFLKGHGMQVHSYYGLGQWMARPYVNEMEDNVTVYPYDIKAATALLVKDGWTLNESGAKFVAGTDAVRYKKQGSELVPLKIDYAQLKDNQGAQLAGEMLQPILESIGFSFEATLVDMDQLLDSYYRSGERKYNMMFLATNFSQVFDPYYTFNTDEVYQGVSNTSGIKDEKLMTLAQKMRRQKPTATEQYEKYWMDLMQRFSELLPTLPIYSNVYYDFYSRQLVDYNPDAHSSWAAAILYTKIAQ